MWVGLKLEEVKWLESNGPGGGEVLCRDGLN
jgi:hypothetical protein